MKIHERPLPGVGTKYTIRPDAGGQLIVIIHHTGKRELLYFSQNQDEPQMVLDLSDTEAKELGAIVAGMMFQPEAGGEATTQLAGQSIEWHQLPISSDWINKTIGELQTEGLHVLAIMREGGALIPSPDPEIRLQASDTIMVMGGNKSIADFRAQFEID